MVWRGSSTWLLIGGEIPYGRETESRGVRSQTEFGNDGSGEGACPKAGRGDEPHLGEPPLVIYPTRSFTARRLPTRSTTPSATCRLNVRSLTFSRSGPKVTAPPSM